MAHNRQKMMNYTKMGHRQASHDAVILLKF